jgi:hypothetical protein
MSRRIYQAWKIVPLTVGDLLSQLYIIRERMEQTMMRSIISNSAKNLSLIVDEVHFFGSTRPEYYGCKDKIVSSGTTLQHLLYRLQRCAVRASYDPAGTRIPEAIDVSASCVVIEHPFQNALILKLFCENTLAAKLFSDAMERLDATVFDYWDHLDAPKEVSKRDWDERKIAWSSLSQLYGPYNRMGFVFELGLKENSFAYPSVEDIEDFSRKCLESIPGRQERARHIAETKLFEMYYDARKKSDSKPGSTYREFQKWVCNDPEGQKSMTGLYREVESELIGIGPELLHVKVDMKQDGKLTLSKSDQGEDV